MTPKKENRDTDIRNDADIERLVHRFYEKVRLDDRLGYIFNEVAGTDWESHLPRMVDFWSNLLFRTGRYQGRPYRRHVQLPVRRSDFRRWYNLFVETVDELYTGDKAEYAKEMAAKIASSFSVRMDSEGKFEGE